MIHSCKLCNKPEFYIHDCNSCNTVCRNKSKENCDFKEDSELSKEKENQVISYINDTTNLFANKTKTNELPDIEIYSNKKKDTKLFFIEVKVQQSTFMSIEHLLKDANIKPSESIALNFSDLLRYFSFKGLSYNPSFKNNFLSKCKESVLKTRIKEPLYICWFLSNRPCLSGNNKNLVFHQNIEVLHRIYLYYESNVENLQENDFNYNFKRSFKRKFVKGDYDNSGNIKGVRTNYHFSLKELIPGFPPEMSLVNKNYYNKIKFNT